jgi:hypothetical protein
MITYWDSRPDSSTDWIDMTGLGGSCRDNPSMYGFVYNFNAEKVETPVSVLTLCQNRIPNWIADYNNGNTMSNLQQGTYPLGSVSLDAIHAMLAPSLVHELSHCTAFMGTQILGQSLMIFA